MTFGRSKPIWPGFEQKQFALDPQQFRQTPELFVTRGLRQRFVDCHVRAYDFPDLSQGLRIFLEGRRAIKGESRFAEFIYRVAKEQ
jgi:hypothetical protein